MNIDYTINVGHCHKLQNVRLKKIFEYIKKNGKINIFHLSVMYFKFL